MTTRKKILIAVIAVMAFLLLDLLLIVNHYVGMINKDTFTDFISPDQENFEVDYEAGAEGGVDPNDVNWEAFEPLMDDELLNILLVGQDRRPGEGRQRSDSMILCSFNLKTKEVSMISLMRDLYVQFPKGFSDNRLNAAYAFGGFSMLKDTLEKNFGLTVDGCFEVDFDGFEKVIDTIGGVDIELSEGEAYEVAEGTVKGWNHLNGYQALTYARIRKLDNDFGRTQRQRTVLMAVYDQMKECSVMELNDMANEILPHMTTDLSNAQIMGILFQCTRLIGSAEINTYCIPAEGEYKNENINGMSVLVPDLPLIREHLEDYLPFDDKDKKEN